MARHERTAMQHGRVTHRCGADVAAIVHQQLCDFGQFASPVRSGELDNC